MLGVRVRALRQQRDLAQNELARRVGIKPHTLWRIETGKHKNPRADVLKGLARELGVTVDDLLGGIPPRLAAS